MTFFLYRRLRDVESALVPHGLQNVVEALLEAFFGICEQVAGTANARRFFPMVATIFVFLLVGNLFGLFPWNNVIGKTIDERAEYLHHLEEDAVDLWPISRSAAFPSARSITASPTTTWIPFLSRRANSQRRTKTRRDPRGAS